MTFDITQALLAARVARPYYARAIAALTTVPVKGLNTVAVDKYWRLYYDPEWLEKLPLDQQAAVIAAHEVEHLLRCHSTRRETISAQPKPWNACCFPAGTLLTNGKLIENCADMVRPYSGDLTVVTHQAGILKATPDHPVFVRKRKHKVGLTPVRLKDPEWLAISQIRVGDFVCVPKIERYGLRHDKTIDLSQFINTVTDSLGRETGDRNAVKSIALNVDTAWLIGLYTAEGSSSPSVSFSLGAHEKWLAEEVKRIVSDIGYSASIHVRGTSAVVHTGSILLGRWLKQEGGANARVKNIPDVILRHANPDIRKAYVNGLVAGDGYVCSRDDRHWATVGVASPSLIRDLILLLAQDDIGVHFSTQTLKPRWIGDSYTECPTVLYKATWSLSAASTAMRILNGKCVTTSNRRWKVDDIGVWYPVKQTDSEFYEGSVYNLVNTPDHTYIAESTLVHNCDAEINDDCSDLTLPPNGVYPKALNQADGLTAEEYYANLETHNGKTCGGGSGVGDPKDFELPGDAAPGVQDEAAAENLRDAVAQDVKEAIKRDGIGNIPAGVRMWADARTAPVKIDWRRELQSLIARTCREAVRGRQDFTWGRLSRRGGDVLRPGMLAYLPKVAVVVDTSGSMGDERTGELVHGTMRTLATYKPIVVQCDAEVKSTKRGTKQKFIGGGGTDLRVGLDKAYKEADVVIVITDGETPWPETGTKPTVVVLIGSGKVPEWAKTIKVDQ